MTGAQKSNRQRLYSGHSKEENLTLYDHNVRGSKAQKMAEKVHYRGTFWADFWPIISLFDVILEKKSFKEIQDFQIGPFFDSLICRDHCKSKKKWCAARGSPGY